MITLTTPNSKPGSLEILAVAEETNVSLKVPFEERDQDSCCSCGFVCGCEYVEYAFGGSNDYETDKTVRFFKKEVASDTVAMELWKNGAKLADLNTDTYGTYFNGVGPDDLYVGYEVNWKTVLDAGGAGAGIYQIVTNLDIAGVAFTRNSHKFRCLAFDECKAEGTVRIESRLDKNIDDVFNYDGLNQDVWVRVKGKLLDKKASPEDSEYENSQRRVIDYQSKTNWTYLLVVNSVPSQVYNLILQELLVADDIRISDYSLPFFESYKSIELKRDSYEDPVWSDNGTKASFNVRMKTRENKPLGRYQ